MRLNFTHLLQYVAFTLLIIIMQIGVLFAQNVGIGIAQPENQLDVNGSISIGQSFLLQQAPESGLITEGAVGIGVSNPSADAKLHLNQNVSNQHGIISIVSNTAIGKSALIAKNQSDSGIGVIGISGNYGHLSTGSFPFPSGMQFVGSGLGGSFAGKIGLYAFTNNHGGIALLAENSHYELAAHFKGNIASAGRIKNPNESLYRGSVYVNDGLTVGVSEGELCEKNNQEICTFSYLEPDWKYVEGWSEVYPNNPVCTTGDCREITNVEFTAVFKEFLGLSLNVELHLGNLDSTYIGTFLVTQIEEQPYPLYPGSVNLYLLDATFNTQLFNGYNPSDINWDFQFNSIGYAGYNFAVLHEYSSVISYDYGFENTGPAEPVYAAFGEVRASGVIYANANSPYGDVAEYFNVNPDLSSRKPEPGDIVSFSTTESETFKLSNRANDPLIAGVISENPSVFLNSPNSGMPIALTGRVRVKVNSEGGPIRAGDPITSSSVEGIGKRMNEDESGMIVGYAMQSFDGSFNDEAKIWILLNKKHYENANRLPAKIVQGKDFSLNGIEINGSVNVEEGESTVFVNWNDNLRAQFKNADIDFDALVVDLKPNGGFANLYVKNVSEEGFSIGLHKQGKSTSFIGVFYRVKILLPDGIQVDKQHLSDKLSSANGKLSFDERLQASINLNNQIESIFYQILTKTGQLDAFEALRNKSRDENVAFLKNLKANEPDLFSIFNQKRKALNALINQDTELMTSLHRSISHKKKVE